LAYTHVDLHAAMQASNEKNSLHRHIGRLVGCGCIIAAVRKGAIL
jgi:hypothetical protein